VQWLTRFAATDNKVRAGMVSVRRKDSAAGVWRARYTHLALVATGCQNRVRAIA
jgi:hypothetical protein